MTSDSTTGSIDYEAIFEDVMTGIIEHGKDNPEEALRILIRYGGIDGSHHKDWVIDPADLLDIEYEYKHKFVDKFPQFKSLITHPFKIMSLAHYS
jgi:hypothetical protein